MKRFYSALRFVGLDPKRMVKIPGAMLRLRRDMTRFKAMEATSRTKLPFGKFYPCIEDSGAESGTASGHYFHQDLHVARRIYKASPRRHADVASRVDGFVAHVAVFREIEVLDIRTLTTTASNIVFRQCDIMGDLPEQFVGQFDSLSCLHALEHFGLGRYGDPLDPDGHLRGLANLHRALEPGGALYLAIPMGPDRIEFNAHRVLSTRSILDLLDGRFDLVRFSYVNDAGDFFDGVDLTPSEIERSFGCHWGLGIVEARKAPGSPQA